MQKIFTFLMTQERAVVIATQDDHCSIRSIAGRLGRASSPILKNACRVEALQLGTIERLERAIALFMVVAWRIAHLMRLGRTCPDLDAALFFDPDEIQGAYLLMEMKQPTKPTLNEVLRLIARLGGFISRKSDGEPDVKTIWLGLK